MNINKSSASSGLSTDTYIVGDAGMHYLSAQSSLLPPSGVTITLTQTGSASVSLSVGPSGAQQDKISAQKVFNCQPGDVLTVVLTSSAPIDQPPNLIKTIVNLRQGST